MATNRLRPGEEGLRGWGHRHRIAALPAARRLFRLGRTSITRGRVRLPSRSVSAVSEQRSESSCRAAIPMSDATLWAALLFPGSVAPARARGDLVRQSRRVGRSRASSLTSRKAEQARLLLVSMLLTSPGSQPTLPSIESLTHFARLAQPTMRPFERHWTRL